MGFKGFDWLTAGAFLRPPCESESKPGTKMVVIPEPCKELRGGRSYLWLGLSLTNLHLPGFSLWLMSTGKSSETENWQPTVQREIPSDHSLSPKGKANRFDHRFHKADVCPGLFCGFLKLLKLDPEVIHNFGGLHS